MKIKIDISGTLRDPNGKILRRTSWRKANSALIQLIRLILVDLSQTAYLTKRSNNTDESQGPAATLMRTNAPAGTKTYGILIGTVNTAVTIADFVMAAIATTNIDYSAHTYGVEQPTASSYRCTISRTFTNNTAAALAIEEIGLAVLPSSGSNYYLIDRTLLTLSVPIGTSQTLVYRLTISL